MKHEIPECNNGVKTSVTVPESVNPVAGIIMGSRSDWPTMKHASDLLNQFGIVHENRVVSAHRTPEWLMEYAKSAHSRGLKVIIAGAGGAAHLPGMVASLTSLPVLGVPIQSQSLNGLDSLLSIVQMPGGIPVGTLAIGESGARNAALLALRILAVADPDLLASLETHRKQVAEKVMQDAEIPNPIEELKS